MTLTIASEQSQTVVFKPRVIHTNFFESIGANLRLLFAVKNYESSSTAHSRWGFRQLNGMINTVVWRIEWWPTTLHSHWYLYLASCCYLTSWSYRLFVANSELFRLLRTSIDWHSEAENRCQVVIVYGSESTADTSTNAFRRRWTRANNK